MKLLHSGVCGAVSNTPLISDVFFTLLNLVTEWTIENSTGWQHGPLAMMNLLYCFALQCNKSHQNMIPLTLSLPRLNHLGYNKISFIPNQNYINNMVVNLSSRFKGILYLLFVLFSSFSSSLFGVFMAMPQSSPYAGATVIFLPKIRAPLAPNSRYVNRILMKARWGSSSLRSSY